MGFHTQRDMYGPNPEEADSPIQWGLDSLSHTAILGGQSW